jgi:hypothetical protein
VLDHYLEQLLYKTNAFDDARVVQEHPFKDYLLELLALLRSKYEYKEANREFVLILILLRTSTDEELKAAIEFTKQGGGLNATGITDALKHIQNVIEVEGLPNIENNFNLDKYLELEVEDEYCGNV